MEDIPKIKKVAEETAREAGSYILERVGHLKEIAHKSGIHDLVTDVDKTSEKMIIDRINREFPSHAVLAEESGGQAPKDAVSWIVDPLDGTTNYTHSYPVFCVSIGVLIDGAVRVGVIYDPSREETFVAEEGKGARLNGQKIKVSPSGALADSLLATGFAYDLDCKIANLDYFRVMLESAQAVRRAGSAALDLCYVACGRFDGFWEMCLNPWDTAAGQLMVREAGGRVTGLDGGPFDIFNKGMIIATNGNIHDELLGRLNIQ
jgi:myo-inositol-1(or 4)-monophosphatase